MYAKLISALLLCSSAFGQVTLDATKNVVDHKQVSIAQAQIVFNASGSGLITGDLEMGKDGTDKSKVTIFGDDTSNGGQIEIFNSNDDDTNSEHWVIEANDLLNIGDEDNGALFTFDSSGNFVATGTVSGSGGTALSNIADDDSPQLGGDLDMTTFSIQAADGEGIQDEGGAKLLVFLEDDTPVTYIQIGNGDTGEAPSITALGETNVDLTLDGNGTGVVKILDSLEITGNILKNSAQIVKLTQASPTPINSLEISTGNTTEPISLLATGGDGNIDLVLDGKGTGKVKLLSSDLDVTGAGVFSGSLTAGNGDAAAPGIGFAGEEMGLFWKSGGKLGISTAGTERVVIDSTYISTPIIGLNIAGPIFLQSGNLSNSVVADFRINQAIVGDATMSFEFSVAGIGDDATFRFFRNTDTSTTSDRKVILYNGSATEQIVLDAYTGDILVSGTVDGIDISEAVPLNTAKVGVDTGVVDIAHLSATGTANSTTFLRGDNEWRVPGDLLANGSVELSSNWDVGAFDLTTVDLTATGEVTTVDLTATGEVTIHSATTPKLRFREEDAPNVDERQWLFRASGGVFALRSRTNGGTETNIFHANSVSGVVNTFEIKASTKITLTTPSTIMTGDLSLSTNNAQLFLGDVTTDDASLVIDSNNSDNVSGIRIWRNGSSSEYMTLGAHSNALIEYTAGNKEFIINNASSSAVDSELWLQTQGATGIRLDENQDVYIPNGDLIAQGQVLVTDQMRYVSVDTLASGTTVNWAAGTTEPVAKLTIAHNVTTFNVNNEQQGANAILIITTGGTAYTIAWPSDVEWPNGIAPDLTTINTKYVISLFCYDGENWAGSYLEDLS